MLGDSKAVEDLSPETIALLSTLSLSGGVVVSSKPVTKIVLFNAGTRTGGLGGLVGAASTCTAAISDSALSVAIGFLSSDAQDLNTTPGVPTTVPVQGPTGTQPRRSDR